MKKLKKDVWYYAHSMKTYNTKKERLTREELNNIFPDSILCPNNDVGELGSMKRYLDIVTSCKGVICTDYKGYLAKGTFEEVKLSLSLNKPTYLFSGNKLHEIKKVKVYDKTDWKFKYGIVILKK